MASAWTYDTLSTALQSWITDDGPAFIAALPRIVALAHVKLERDLDLQRFDVLLDVAAVAGSVRLPKPDALYATRALYVRDLTGHERLLEVRSFDVVMDMAADPVVFGVPRYWCDAGPDHWRIAPRPAANLCVCARVTPAPTVMSADNTTTWLGSHAPEALFYAALMESEAFIKADDRVQLWATRYINDILPATRRELAMTTRADAPLAQAG